MNPSIIQALMQIKYGGWVGIEGKNEYKQVNLGRGIIKSRVETSMGYKDQGGKNKSKLVIN